MEEDPGASALSAASTSERREGSRLRADRSACSDDETAEDEALVDMDRALPILPVLTSQNTSSIITRRT